MSYDERKKAYEAEFTNRTKDNPNLLNVLFWKWQEAYKEKWGCYLQSASIADRKHISNNREGVNI